MKCFINWTADLKSSKLWSSQLWTQFKQLRIEAWKSQNFNGVWNRDLAITVRCSNQLSYEATHVGSWSFVSFLWAREEWTWNDSWNGLYIELRIWNQVSYDLRSVLSSWSKSFSRNPEKSFRAVDEWVSVLLLVKLIFIRKSYELNLNWHIENLFFTCTWLSFRPQTFNSYNQNVLVTLRRIAVLVVVVVVTLLFCSAATHQTNIKKLFLEAEPGDFSLFLWSMLFLIIFGEVLFQLIKINWECVFILTKFAHGSDV